MVEMLPVHTKHPIKPLTDQERREALAVMAQADALQNAILKRRRGKPVPSSVPLIRRDREERSRAS